jgi:hypothetical protein
MYVQGRDESSPRSKRAALAREDRRRVSSCVFIDCAQPKSCVDWLPGGVSGPRPIDPDGLGPLPAFSVYCDMTSYAGGWTLALKAGGTFSYASPLWTDDTLLNEMSTDLSPTEAKLRPFIALPFKAIRVMMKTGSRLQRSS